MSVTEPIMLIAGIPEDRVFVHVCYIASHLCEMFPNFQFERICKQREEWEPWLKKFCKTHDWSHTSSPLVWRQVGTRADNATYVGGATQFWEFIREYYGIESRLNDDELKFLRQDFAQEFEVEARINTLNATIKKLHVAILGGDKSLCANLAAELFAVQELHLANGIEIKVYNTPRRDTKLNNQIDNTSGMVKDLDTATIALTINAALLNCDILIILDEILRENEEATDHWLNRNRAAMLELAAQINNFAPNHMKVIFCSTGPNCFNAGVLAAADTKLDTNNITVVSAHQGLEIIRKIPFKETGCPPVWGFLGINHFVDVCNAVQSHEIYRPNNRAINPPKGTTLPLGTRHAELRSIFYIADDNNLRISQNEREAGNIQKCKATCDLLRLWHNESCDNDGQVISLGICSDGTFGIPAGIFFSQPVYLRENEDGSRVWVPCTDFPPPNHPNWVFNSLIESARILVDRLIDAEPCYRKTSHKK